MGLLGCDLKVAEGLLAVLAVSTVAVLSFIVAIIFEVVAELYNFGPVVVVSIIEAFFQMSLVRPTGVARVALLAAIL